MSCTTIWWCCCSSVGEWKRPAPLGSPTDGCPSTVALNITLSNPAGEHHKEKRKDIVWCHSFLFLFSSFSFSFFFFDELCLVVVVYASC